MGFIIPDLSWEEIAQNIEHYYRVNTVQPTAVTNEYLMSIQTVNAALRQGARLCIRTAHHGLTCPPEDISIRSGGVSSSHLPDGCLLILKKVIVEFRQEGVDRIRRITLQFWDETHQQAVTWGAMTIQPQWESIVQQAGAAMERRTSDAERTRGEELLIPESPQPESRSAP